SRLPLTTCSNLKVHRRTYSIGHEQPPQRLTRGGILWRRGEYFHIYMDARPETKAATCRIMQTAQLTLAVCATPVISGRVIGHIGLRESGAETARGLGRRPITRVTRLAIARLHAARPRARSTKAFRRNSAGDSMKHCCLSAGPSRIP